VNQTEEVIEPLGAGTVSNFTLVFTDSEETVFTYGVDDLDGSGISLDVDNNLIFAAASEAFTGSVSVTYTLTGAAALDVINVRGGDGRYTTNSAAIAANETASVSEAVRVDFIRLGVQGDVACVTEENEDSIGLADLIITEVKDVIVNTDDETNAVNGTTTVTSFMLSSESYAPFQASNTFSAGLVSRNTASQFVITLDDIENDDAADDIVLSLGSCPTPAAPEAD
jgi:hypothetical protein